MWLTPSYLVEGGSGIQRHLITMRGSNLSSSARTLFLW